MQPAIHNRVRRDGGNATLRVGGISLRSLAKGTLWLGCLSSVGLLLQLLFQFQAANLLGLSEFGRLTHMLAICSFIPLVAHFGTDRILVCELARNPGRWPQIVQTALLQRLLLGPLVGATLFAALVCDGEPQQLQVAFPLVLLGIVSALDLVYLFDAQGHAWKHSAALAGRSLGYVTGVVALDRLGWASAVNGAWMMATVSTGFLAYQLHYATTRGWSPLQRCSWRTVGRMLRGSSSIAMATACIQIYLQGPVVLLGFLGDKAEVGPVVIAVQAVTVLVGMIGLAYRLLLPRLTALFLEAPEEALAAIRRVSPLMLYVSTACTAVVWWATPWLLALLKPQYADAVHLTRITLCTVPLINWASIYGTSFLAMGQVRPYLACAAAGAVVAMGVCAALVPLCGGLGAVAGLAAAQVVASLTSAAAFARRSQWVRATAGSSGSCIPPPRHERQQRERGSVAGAAVWSVERAATNTPWFDIGEAP